MIEKSLAQLGLNETETKVYLALLSSGVAPASTVGIRASIPRSTAKYVCEELSKKGIVIRYIKNNVALYSAKNPDYFKLVIEKEKEALHQKETALSNVIETLGEIFRSRSVVPKINYYDGIDGICEMFDDVIKEQKPIYGALRFDEAMDPKISSYLNETYVPARKRLRFPAWMLFNDNEMTQKYRTEDMGMNRISLLVPSDRYPFDICFHIYGDKVAFYSYKETDLTGAIIQNPFIRNMQFSIFKLAWDSARTLEINSSFRKVEL